MAGPFRLKNYFQYLSSNSLKVEIVETTPVGFLTLVINHLWMCQSGKGFVGTVMLTQAPILQGAVCAGPHLRTRITWLFAQSRSQARPEEHLLQNRVFIAADGQMRRCYSVLIHRSLLSYVLSENLMIFSISKKPKKSASLTVSIMSILFIKCWCVGLSKLVWLVYLKKNIQKTFFFLTTRMWEARVYTENVEELMKWNVTWILLCLKISMSSLWGFLSRLSLLGIPRSFLAVYSSTRTQGDLDCYQKCSAAIASNMCHHSWSQDLSVWKPQFS